MRYFFAFISCVTATLGYGQNRVLIDSLSTRLKETPHEKQFDILNKLGWEYRFSKPDSTIFYAQKAYELGKELRITFDLAKPLNYIGVAYNYKGDKTKAFDYYQQAVAVAERQKDIIQLAYTNNNIGRLLLDQGLLPRSFNYFLIASNLFKQATDSSGLAYVKQSLGDVYRLQKDFRKAENELIGSLKIRLRLKNQRDIMAAFVKTGTLFQEENNFARSTYYLLKGDSVGRLTSDNINLAEIKILLGENYLSEGKLAEADKIGSEGFYIIETYRNNRMLPRALLLMGKIHKAKKNYVAAKKRFQEALTIARSSQLAAFQIESHLQLADLAKRMGNKQEEISNMNQYFVLKDSVEDLELVRKVERLQFEIQIQDKEKENELLKVQQAKVEAEVGRQRIITIFTFAVAGFALVLASVAFYIGYKRRVTSLKLEAQNMLITAHQKEINQQNADLQKSNKRLSEINHEKDTLMSIVAHDLKSPLNRISGLISLVELDGELNTRQKEYTSKIKEVTQSGAALITDLLDVHAMEQDKNVPVMKAFNLADLVNERVDYFRLIAAAKNIKIHYEMASWPSVISDPTYVSRILENLLSNAIKFSHPSKQIIVSLQVLEGKARLSVKDQGQGFTEADQATMFQKFKRLSARPTAGESSNGLGLAIVKTLVDRLMGEVTLISKPGDGSEFVVVIPTTV